MKNDETTTIEKLQKIDLSKLDTVTIESIREQKPKIFAKEPFIFLINDLSKALVIPGQETRVGSGDMYVLDTVPKIYTFGNAYDQLEQFCCKNDLTRGSKVHYLKKFIPAGKDSFSTTYSFEVFKETKK